VGTRSRISVRPRFNQPSPTLHVRSSSFTLIELVFVMAILGILLATSLPRFLRTADRLRTERAASELAQILRYAHERAVAEGREMVWRWDESAHRGWLESASDDGTFQPIEDRVSFRPPSGEVMVIALVRDGVPVDRVPFFPDGTSQQSTLYVSHGDDRYTVTVNEATGQTLFSARPPAR